MIPYGKHTLLEQDIDAVVDVLKNQFLTQGSQVPLFEQELCRYTGYRPMATTMTVSTPK